MIVILIYCRITTRGKPLVFLCDPFFSPETHLTDYKHGDHNDITKMLVLNKWAFGLCSTYQHNSQLKDQSRHRIVRCSSLGIPTVNSSAVVTVAAARRLNLPKDRNARFPE